MTRFTGCPASCLKSFVIFVASTIQRVPSLTHEKSRKHTLILVNLPLIFKKVIVSILFPKWVIGNIIITSENVVYQPDKPLKRSQQSLLC